MKTLILCGGQGTRLRSVMRDRPKVLAPVLGRPFLEWVLLGLRSEGLGEVTLCTVHGHDEIAGTLGVGNCLGVSGLYSQVTWPLVAAGAIVHESDGQPYYC